MASRKEFGKSLEEFEVAKLIKKYTKLGYEVIDEDWPHLSFIPDLHIINKEIEDEIIFEIKSKYRYNKDFLEIINAQRTYYRYIFPNARFVLVLAKEEQPISFEGEMIKTLLLDFIKSNYAKELNKFFPKNNIELEEVDYFECSNVDFENFENIKLRGQANLKFWIEVNEETFIGKRLADGITFNFDLKMKFEPNKTSLYQIDEQSSQISFDFS